MASSLSAFSRMVADLDLLWSCCRVQVLQYTVLPSIGWAISRFWGLTSSLAIGVALVSLLGLGAAVDLWLALAFDLLELLGLTLPDSTSASKQVMATEASKAPIWVLPVCT